MEASADTHGGAVVFPGRSLHQPCGVAQMVSALEDLGFTLTGPPKKDGYNLKSPILVSELILRISASGHNFGPPPRARGLSQQLWASIS